MKQRSFFALGLAAALLASPAMAADARPGYSKVGEWQFYGGSNGGQKYAPLDQINAKNVNQLKVVWRQTASPPEALSPTGKPLVGSNYEHTPLMVNGVLYARSDAGPVMAMDPGTGKVLWVDNKAQRGGGRSRGISYWTDGKDARIFALDGENLVAVNAKTGERYANFGADGAVDLKVYADPRPNSPVGGFQWSSFPVVVGDIVVIAGVPRLAEDKVPAGMTPALDPPGDIRGYDVRTGKIVWTFHVIPRKGEFGYDTWTNGGAEINGAAGTWTWLTADEELGHVYIGTEAPSNDFFGGLRQGDGLFGNTVLALDAKTGKRAWHFQVIKHDLWDFDNPVPPIVTDITVDGKRIKALVQLTKQAFAYVLDRETGKPVWPMDERPVPKGNIPGEYYASTQLFPTKPPPFELQMLTENDLIDYSPELKAAALEVTRNIQFVPIFTPATTTHEIGMLPGTTGAANWNGAGFDPETGRLYIPVLRNAVRTMIIERKDPKSPYAFDRKPEPLLNTNIEIPYQDINPNRPAEEGAASRIPITKGPYGAIVAMDLNKGEILWKVANGDRMNVHPALKDLNLPELGSENRASPLVTKTLLFIGEGKNGPGGPSRIPAWGGGKSFRALDKVSGKEIFKMELPGGTSGAPITYMHGGKQYIVVAVGWHDMPAEYVALALP